MSVVSSAKEEGKNSDAFYLGCTTLILNASQKKKTKLKCEKGARLSLFCCSSLITSPIKRGARFKTFIVTNGERREQERERRREVK